MADESQRFSFVSRGSMPADTFGVVRFKGIEGLSTVYEFDITLISDDPAIDMSEVVQNPARFTILRDEGDIPFYGIPVSFEQMHEVDGTVFYRVVLAPKLWWLSQTYHNQVFLHKTVPQILEAVLKDGGLTENDFDLRLEDDYRQWEYVCQYRESHLNFICRWMEREGMYFFFEQGQAGEKLIITDSNIAHTPMPQGKTMYYSPPSAMDALSREEVVKNFCCRQKTLPSSVRLKDYNYEKPSLAIEGLADVYEEGRGEVYLYGDHFLTPEEGNHLAKIRAQELNCWERTYHGESTVPFLRPGFTFGLEDHYRGDFNLDYLAVEVTHEGSQAAYMLAGLSSELAEAEKSPYYVNTFTALPAGVQFRPQRKTEKARFYGTMHARIDAAGSGKYAEIDEQGRYKVVLPFDRSGRFGGKASAWIRMMQPYAGPNQGMHFPLHKGTEILLTFIDGDPDRPIIAGAVPNPETTSPVTSANPTKSTIRTGRSPEDASAGAGDARARDTSDPNNFIEFDDAADSEKIEIHSPNKIETFAGGKYKRREIGPSEESGHDKFNDDGSGNLSTTDAVTAVDGLLETLENFSPGNVFGYDEGQQLAASSETPPNGFPEEYDEAPVPAVPENFENYFDNVKHDWCCPVGEPDYEYEYHDLGDFYDDATAAWEEYWSYWVSRNHSNAKGYQNVVFYYPEAKDDDTYNTIATPWYLIYMSPSDHNYDTSTWDSHCQTEWNDWVDQRIEDWQQWQTHLYRGHMRASHRDTFNIQEGNIYDFGGYWNYNLGNCYVEEHLDQSPKLNKTRTDDLLDAGGPGWTKVDWTKAQDSDASHGPSEDDIKLSGYWDDSEGGTNVWVNKTFGNGYTYAEGKSIEVTKGDSLEIQHGGHHVDMAFRGDGSIKSWSRSGGGISREKKWNSGGKLIYKSHYESASNIKSEHTYCVDSGNLISFSSQHQGANSKHTFDFNWANTASASVSFSAGASFAFSMGISAAINIAASASFALNLSAALNIKIDITPLDIDIKVPFSGIGINTTKGGKTELDLPGVSLVIEGPGPDIKVKGAGPKVVLDSTADLKMNNMLELKSGSGIKLNARIINMFC
ncbi:MAG: type VI secretion system tip protein TssI/VgrG [Thermodesulfobacteriota bacterium]|nr:type VI secretion system tip protein TssI/VgrG [Thermodesulfobacteriota bacterium]